MVILEFLMVNYCKKKTLILGNAFYGTPGIFQVYLGYISETSQVFLRPIPGIS